MSRGLLIAEISVCLLIPAIALFIGAVLLPHQVLLLVTTWSDGVDGWQHTIPPILYLTGNYVGAYGVIRLVRFVLRPSDRSASTWERSSLVAAAFAFALGPLGMNVALATGIFRGDVPWSDGATLAALIGTAMPLGCLAHLAHLGRRFLAARPSGSVDFSGAPSGAPPLLAATTASSSASLSTSRSWLRAAVYVAAAVAIASGGISAVDGLLSGAGWGALIVALAGTPGMFAMTLLIAMMPMPGAAIVDRLAPTLPAAARAVLAIGIALLITFMVLWLVETPPVQTDGTTTIYRHAGPGVGASTKVGAYSYVLAIAIPALIVRYWLLRRAGGVNPDVRAQRGLLTVILVVLVGAGVVGVISRLGMAAREAQSWQEALALTPTESASLESLFAGLKSTSRESYESGNWLPMARLYPAGMLDCWDTLGKDHKYAFLSGPPIPDDATFVVTPLKEYLGVDVQQIGATHLMEIRWEVKYLEACGLPAARRYPQRHVFLRRSNGHFELRHACPSPELLNTVADRPLTMISRPAVDAVLARLGPADRQGALRRMRGDGAHDGAQDVLVRQFGVSEDLALLVLDRLCQTEGRQVRSGGRPHEE